MSEDIVCFIEKDYLEAKASSWTTDFNPAVMARVELAQNVDQEFLNEVAEYLNGIALYDGWDLVLIGERYAAGGTVNPFLHRVVDILTEYVVNKIEIVRDKWYFFEDNRDGFCASNFINFEAFRVGFSQEGRFLEIQRF